MEKSFLFYLLRTSRALVPHRRREGAARRRWCGPPSSRAAARRTKRGFVPIIIIIALNSSGLKKYSYIQSKWEEKKEAAEQEGRRSHWHYSHGEAGRQGDGQAGRQAGIHSRRQRRCCCYSLARRCLPFYRICIWLSDWGDQGGRVKCFGSPSPHIVSQRARLVVWKRRACHWTMQCSETFTTMIFFLIIWTLSPRISLNCMKWYFDMTGGISFK